MSENRSTLQEPSERSQHLTFVESNDKIVIDSLTVKKLALLVEQCVYNLQSSRDCDILLTSLDNYLGESSNPEEARKSSLLLNMYRDVVPEWLEEAEEWLTEGVHLTFANVSKKS